MKYFANFVVLTIGFFIVMSAMKQFAIGGQSAMEIAGVSVIFGALMTVYFYVYHRYFLRK